MYWTDEGFLISKSNFKENSIIIEAFTMFHGKYSGIVYGGSSRKQKKNFQIGNKISINWKSKNENKPGYFNIELIKPIAPLFFDDKKRSICILSSASILKTLLPEGQINKKIYKSFEIMLNDLKTENWIILYIFWELLLIKELGYEINFLEPDIKIDNSIKINDKLFKIPKIIYKKSSSYKNNKEIKEALIFNRELIMENFIIPNKLKFPFSRKILENYYN